MIARLKAEDCKVGEFLDARFCKGINVPHPNHFSGNRCVLHVAPRLTYDRVESTITAESGFDMRSRIQQFTFHKVFIARRQPAFGHDGRHTGTVTTTECVGWRRDS